MKQLVVMPVAGLCNRFQTIVCGQLMAEDTNRSLFVNWRPARDCAIAYDDLFTRPLRSLDKLPDDTVCYTSLRRNTRQSAAGPYFDLLNRDPRDDFRKLGRDPSPTIAIISCHQFMNYFHDPRFGPRLRDLMRDVRPEIMRKVNDFVGRHFTERTIGVHVRRGDWGRQRDLGYYLGRMERFSGATFFISSDDPGVFDSIHSRHPGSIEYSCSSLARDTREGIIEAMIDMLLLSRTSYLVSTPGSSFSAIAQVAGDIPGDFEYGLSVSLRDLRLGNLPHPGRALIRRVWHGVKR